MSKKIILIGAGQRGYIYADYALANPQDLTVVGVAEGNPDRRRDFQKRHGLDDSACLSTWEDVFKREKWADAVMICTQDTMHYEPVMEAIKQGYDILLEKPIAPTEGECMEIAAAAKEAGVKVVVCHILRYTPFFAKIKSILDSGAIGEVVSFVHNENVGDVHHSHSYTRGHWRNTAQSGPMILTKACHDLDMMQWLLGKNCLALSSFGSLKYFHKGNAPAAAPARCTDGCTVDCPYDARKLYVESDNDWFRSVAAGHYNPTNEEVLAAIKNGPYGRCVYKCDNDVVDHQVVNMLFEDGITAVFSMSSLTPDTCRSLKIMGTKGELKAHTIAKTIVVTDFVTRQVTETVLTDDVMSHVVSDNGLMASFSKYLRGELDSSQVSEVGVSALNHRLCFKAEESRIGGGRLMEL